MTGNHRNGYRLVVEWSLSLDNVFVFALVFAYFAVPKELRYRVLSWGVLLAIVLRSVFIVVGATLLESFAWVAYVFGAFLVATGLRVARHKAVVLVFVGTKMLVSDWWKVPVWVSLPVILGLLGGTALVSWLRGRRRRGEAPVLSMKSPA